MILAGCPVKDRGWILRLHLAALKPQIGGLYYLANDCTDDTEEILTEFHADYDVYNTGNEHHERHQRSEENMAEVFNEWLRRSLRYAYDYLYLCSSDVVVGHGLVDRLLRTAREKGDRAIVGPVMWSNRGVMNWMMEKSVNPLRYTRKDCEAQKEAFPVDMIGGCLLPRRAVESGARHRPHPQSHICPWFKELRELGYEIWAEPRVTVSHWFRRDRPYIWDERCLA